MDFTLRDHQQLEKIFYFVRQGVKVRKFTLHGLRCSAIANWDSL